ncbi:serine hydrolase domain-containing protein [Nocardia sp. NPDC058176]|uniref:serine hydrolase domain-containing protein n=1 Tax=Nocardia sp. NPDC058176 TaxID=3346368 RepID=UPI0036DB71B7
MSSRSIARLAGSGIALLSVAALLAPAATAAPPAQCAEPAPGAVPEIRAAETVGMDAAAVADAVAFGAQHLAHAVQIYRHGCLVGQHLATGELPMPLASGSKGVAAVAVGRAITLGHFGLDDPIGTFFPEADPAHARITVRQILNQTSGLHFTWADDIASTANSDSVTAALTAPVAAEPGTTFLYAQNVLVLLAEIVERTTGTEFVDFVHQELMAPLGIDRGAWNWSRDDSGKAAVAGGLSMRAADLARIGRLLLQDGRWADRPLIDPAFIRAGTTPSAANGGYGFLWWLNAGENYRSVDVPAQLRDRRVLEGLPADTYTFSGALGQFAVMIPSLDLVVIRLGVPDTFDPADPLNFLTGTGNPNNAELFRRAAAAVIR